MKITIVRIILVILILLNFITIFSFSEQDGVQSGGLSRRVTLVILNVFGDYNEPLSEEQEVQVENVQHVIRKLAHFTIYAILGLLLMSLAETFDFTNKKRIILSLLVGILYASLDEFHQSFIPGRTAAVTDVLIDTAGVIIGILFIFLVLKIIQSKRKKKKTNKVNKDKEKVLDA